MTSFFTDLAQQYIDGEWRPGKGSWDIIDFNPYSGEKLASITVATADEVDQAYRAAERTQPEWADTNPYARRAVLEKALRVVEEREDEIGEAIVAELGGTRLKAGFELHLAKEFLREAAQLTLRSTGQILPSPTEGKENRVYRLPAGVVGVISPFNFPFLLSLKSVAPALALGNAVVLKPHQNTPVCGGTLIAKVFEEAGLPPGLLNVVVTDIAEIGDSLLEHPVPQVISFTGSDRIGRHVARVCAAHLKRAVLELGGNSALIVLDDADVDYAVDAAVFSRYIHQGQVCMAANRILVDRSVEQEFTEKFVAKVASLRVGDPADPATHIGPLISSSQADAVSRLVDETVAAGATALLHGRAEGNVVSPSVLTGLAADSPVLQQEIFGPVALLVPFDGEDEAVRIANDTPYGLSGAVHTGNIERGVRVGQRIRTGMIHINDGTVHDEPIVPFGGEKNSGLGRLNGESMLEAFTTQKWISVQHGRSQFPF
ncbi:MULTISPECIES: aldehyde dehydrogenase family protein [Streptomyces]|uniref:Aldehyde dehydrogenase family protein n=1 Tax=Streptomyces glycanivorans TaxID=3033808 RepID=A0ABY9JLY5_9ACTN|nr:MULTISPECIES: aldehyde dehydrogenase family protein [unclassified Streptomyces]WSQ81138.1 aldehyde dehydrogenase family protein [Streptomyces sp. NBC_01213]TXS10446.1 aldehyde dehydrogenase family protein [Streptomyces sp. wa22]WLQ67794.1 aldehyde dehydrogenase family protein [Streptomyces sp. Alt3]WSR05524.1 aldehyde dehydrogenase family protein [Streptomyces sp. NBC_01208]WSR51865.1 aldehyde dehydrogenase family protein [Streptomyces sp. NBC_01201]